MKLMAWCFMAVAALMGIWIIFGAAPDVSMGSRIALASISPAITLILVYLVSQAQ